jgi:hypothetical protein
MIASAIGLVAAQQKDSSQSSRTTAGSGCNPSHSG